MNAPASRTGRRPTAPEGPAPSCAAHVDTPKGDLDGSPDALSGTGTTVIAGSSVYPHGTTEQYPYMADSAGTVSHEHGPRLRRVRQQGHLRPQVRRVRVLPGLFGRGLPEGDLRRPDVQRPRHLHERAGFGRRGTTATSITSGTRRSPFPASASPATRARRALQKCASLGIDDDYIMMTTSWPSARRRRACPSPSATPTPTPISPAQDSITGTYAIKFYDAFGEDYETAPARGVSAAKCHQGRARVHGERRRPKHGVSSVIGTETERPEQGGSGNSRPWSSTTLWFTENPATSSPSR